MAAGALQVLAFLDAALMLLPGLAVVMGPLEVIGSAGLKMRLLNSALPTSPPGTVSAPDNHPRRRQGLPSRLQGRGPSMGAWGGSRPVRRAAHPGGVVEWLMAPVLKTGESQDSVGSNPTPSVLHLRPWPLPKAQSPSARTACCRSRSSRSSSDSLLIRLLSRSASRGKAIGPGRGGCRSSHSLS